MHVLKIGGNELSDPSFLSGLAQVVAAANEPIVIVHGGGRAIADLQAKLGLKPVKVDGLRVTDHESIIVAEMALSAQANKLIVKALLAAGVDAIGLSGVDGGLLRCEKKHHQTADLGFVGHIVQVRANVIKTLMESNLTIVLSPISLGIDGHTYNVNADEAASAVALALNADLLSFVSNVPGVLQDNALISNLTPAQTDELIQSGIINGGMVPKVRAALQAIEQGVPKARILNLAGLQTSGGTLFTNTGVA
ncbi:MAG: acetylglutamate kinase [Anaerolineales bacterium]|nr:acetylglutamate kinase [Anaerolineales bacterium]MCA9927481.1 acetylglutamate kinase [Anaerolineales bacterium]